MSGSMDITTTSDNGKSPDAAAAAPTKPSLRSLDQPSTSPSTHEQDLTHGPLLLGFGDGQEYIQDPHLSQLELELASQESAHYSANESRLPSLPMGVPLSSSAQAMTLSTISRSGQSFSVPSSTEEQTTMPASWHYEFSWENSRLCFDGEPLDIGKASEEQSEANPASESGLSASQASFPGLPAPLSGACESDPFSTTGIGGFCSSAESRPILSLPQDFEVAFMGSSSSSDSSELDYKMENDYTEESSDPNVAIAMEKRAEWVARLLIDDFFRSHARRKSRPHTAAAKDQDQSSEPGNKAQQFDGDRRHLKRPRKSRATGGSGGDGDEDSGEDGQGPSSAAKSGDIRYLACPFLKWNPTRFAKTCTRKFKQIRNVKYHLERIHQGTYCPECETIFSEENITAHRCDADRVRPRAIMTEEKFLKIKAIPGSEVEWKKKQQWHEIWKIIFPNDPPCLSPYFNKEAERRLNEAERYLRLPQVHAVICEEMKSGGFKSQVIRSFYELLCFGTLPGVLEESDVNDEGGSCIAHDNNHAAQHAQPSKAMESGACETTISHDTGNHTSQHPHDGKAMPESCAVTRPTDCPGSMSEVFAAQEQSGNITNDFFPGLTNSGELPDPTRRGLMGVCESDSWEMPLVQNFVDPSWSVGYEVGSDLMSEP